LHRSRCACLSLHLKWSPIVCFLWMRDRWASSFRYFLKSFVILYLVVEMFHHGRIYSYFDFGLKHSSFWLHYQRPSSSADCARELFKGSNGSTSLVDCIRKKIFWLRGVDFCDWRHKWSSLVKYYLSEILPPNSWRPGPGKVGQGGLKALNLWCHSQKNASPKQKNFFQEQTRRLVAFFETFTGSVEHTRLEKFLRKATCV